MQMESSGQGRVCGLTRFDMCERCIGNAFLSKKDTDDINDTGNAYFF